jgi:hypothetical protein
MDEDVLFNPDDAELRADEKVCPFCHYVHFFFIACPTCNPKTKTEYERLSNGTQHQA